MKRIRRRFLAPGKASNWEMSGLRENNVWRETRWIMPWSSLSDEFHPNSAEEYQAWKREHGRES